MRINQPGIFISHLQFKQEEHNEKRGKLFMARGRKPTYF